MNSEKIDDVFIRYASDVLGDTEVGLTGGEIVQYCNGYAIDFNVNIPITTSNFGLFGSRVPNKRTALYRNLVEFNGFQQFIIIKDLCELTKFAENKNVQDLKKKLYERFSMFAQKNDYVLIKKDQGIGNLIDDENATLSRVMTILLNIYCNEDEIYIEDNDTRFKDINNYEKYLKRLNEQGYFSKFKANIIGAFKIELSEKAFSYFQNDTVAHTENSLPSVFISYNWKNEKFVDKIEESVKDYCYVKRDQNEIGTWNSISEFMKTIREEDFAVIIISDAYLKSTACLYEVIQLMKDDNWNQKTMYIVMDDAMCIYDLIDRTTYITYWNDCYNRLSDILSRLPASSTYKQAEELKRAGIIRDSIGEFLIKVADKNNPSVNDAIDKIIERIKI